MFLENIVIIIYQFLKKKKSLKNMKVKHELTKMYELISWMENFGGTKSLDEYFRLIKIKCRYI